MIFAHEQAEDWPMPLTSGDREEVREAIARQGFALDLTPIAYRGRRIRLYARWQPVVEQRDFCGSATLSIAGSAGTRRRSPTTFAEFSCSNWARVVNSI